MTLGIFTEISSIIFIAMVMAGLMRILKQPTIIGFILTGVIVGPIAFDIMVRSVETMEIFSKMGVALLLFIIGLGMNPKVIKEVGRVSLTTGLGQIAFTSIIGFGVCMLLGFPFDFPNYDASIIALYVAIALTFSSTIIIIKLLSDKHALQSLYGRISVGFLLVQDVVAIALLIIVPYISGGLDMSEVSTQSVLWSIVVMGGAVLISFYIVPKMCKYFARSTEFLFLFSIAWGLGLASLFLELGFSLEIGALIAGISLSSTPFQHEIGAKMRPLRDFFIMIFFVLLGSQMAMGDISVFIVPIILLSAFILLGNPIIVMALMGLLGYDRKTGFSAGLTVAQISEFSLIFVALGVQQGQLPTEILSLVTAVGIITIAGSTYLIHYSERIYPHLSKLLGIFERKGIIRVDSDYGRSYEAILFGCNRVGHDFLNSFKKLGQKFLAVERDPDIIESLSKKGVRAKYGDAADIEFLEDLGLDKTKIIVSTIPDVETNQVLVREARKENKDAIIMPVAYRIDDAIKLYDLGASYVIMPHFLGGQQASRMVEEYGFDKEKFGEERKDHVKYIKKRKKHGHEHPAPHDPQCRYSNGGDHT
jgi:Kef-type K+ transport system membrane component KefB/Trk K+ transport system NAD-binding subunit